MKVRLGFTYFHFCCAIAYSLLNKAGALFSKRAGVGNARGRYANM